MYYGLSRKILWEDFVRAHRISSRRSPYWQPNRWNFPGKDWQIVTKLLRLQTSWRQCAPKTRRSLASASQGYTIDDSTDINLLADKSEHTVSGLQEIVMLNRKKGQNPSLLTSGFLHWMSFLVWRTQGRDSMPAELVETLQRV